ncbi:hypothetical protein Noda2021_03170 [Candidatus Dependentiae bacterium Noda2021]|nr:hypothetical protein Noda2021_03170 [Candidatus Dependentiae bacterium Noda2021]
MSESPLQLFINLIEFDQSLIKIEKKISALQEQLATLSQQKNHHIKVLESLKNNVTATRKEVDAQELEMKQLDERIARKKEQLDNVTGHREYVSLKAEIDAIRQQQHDLEDRLISVWNAHESAQKEYEGSLSNSHDHIATIERQEHELHQQLTQLNNELSELSLQRDEKQNRIPEEWLEKYAVMRAKISDPVVSAEGAHCHGCAFFISDQEMQQLRHHKLVQCKSCFRLLYLPPRK